MPSGKTHTAMTLGATVVVAGVMWKTGFTAEQIRFATTGCITGVIVSPDLDVDGGFLGHKIVTQYFGMIAGRIWRAFWLPYAWIFSHRGTSHIPVAGTLGRVLYLYGMYFCICVDLGEAPWVPDFHTSLYLLTGLVVVDTLHFIADHISTALKRRRYARLPLPLRRMQARHRTYAQLQRTASQKTQRLRR